MTAINLNEVRATRAAEVKAATSGPTGNKHDTEDEFAPFETVGGQILRFGELHKKHLRYVARWSKWFMYDGKRWAEDETLNVFTLARHLCHEMAALLHDPKNPNPAKEWASPKTYAAVVTGARSVESLAADTRQWDADDWVLNTPGGIIDLRTGENIGHDPARHCTKITTVAPGGDCSLWFGFLDKVTAGDKELQAYLKRMCGYFLTGSIREHALFFIYGSGGNGKGVFLNTISALLGVYQIVSPAQTFAEQKGQRHETELARLVGSRLVISQETEQGQYWAEARIKSLTGGDPIAARFMRADYFEFAPKFKLCIVGNHKPQLRAVDDAIRRRFNLIPFNVKITPQEKDPDLPEKLKAEYGGILQWMIDGCLEWQRDGLNPPETVLAATSDYLDSEDALGLWLSDMCVTPASYRKDWERAKAADVAGVRFRETTLADLFKSWKAYADDNHFPAKNNKFLAQELSNRGFKKGRDMRGTFFTGLRLKTHHELVEDGVREDTSTW